ncbi:MarR family winged helix-turn-helix transcriptional regulator [Niallia sp. NCCP-28]|uniref:MarR family winged helix-turn-helix transcriptional regulator n=1 Tax=Niallia sp. NCCP-28 TaxID=2934712 RepID=UPI00207FB1BA|nr:MarR family transcriptional regulator [Niallia sp. NCCP-28]GKU81952.1 transcriptional regulator [Niallia sp. NCCP-28]
MSNTCSTHLQIFYQLQTLNKNLACKFESCLGSSPSRIEILQQLYHNQEISQKELQKMVKIDNAAVTRHLKQLEAANMVARRKKADDNRITLVCLTEDGRNAIKESLQEKEQFIAQTFKDFSEEELQIFLKMLSKIGTNIASVEIQSINK